MTIPPVGWGLESGRSLPLWRWQRSGFALGTRALACRAVLCQEASVVLGGRNANGKEVKALPL